MSPGRSAALCAALAWLAPGCSCGGDGQVADAGPSSGDGGARTDGAPGPDAAAPLIWIDFSVTGCTGGDEEASGGPLADAGPGPDGGAEPPCRGAAPLALQFTPVAPAQVDVYEWTFGDGSEPDRSATPEHVFTAPGTYDVSLVAQGPGGTASKLKPGLVVVGPAGAGAACEEDAGCQSGDCRCAGGACDDIAAGFCTAGCSGASPCADGVCVDLAAGEPAAPAPWQAALCLPDCAAGEACPAGMVCRALPRGDAAGFAMACFHPALLGDIGDPCRDGTGALRDDLCASGLCLDLGLRGVCSARCATTPCPDGAACATFAGGSPAPSCLARCGPETACDADPGLTCELAGGAGALGFTVDEAPAPAGYCAPRTCESPGDCGSLGLCEGGFCSY